MAARRDRAGRSGGRATIADVAARAGVSTATVSRVLAGIGAARPETRRRVHAAARDLGYRPSRVARSLRVRATRTIGLIVTDIANPYFPEIVRAVEDAARGLDYAILLCNGGEDAEREAAYLDLLADRRVDAIIVASSGLTARHARRLQSAAVPVALVNSAPANGMLPAILSDNRAGTRMATEHLLALGHRAIGHVAGPATNAATAERIAGVRDALAAAGLGAKALTIVRGDGHAAGAGQAFDQLLARSPGTTAVVCYNDLTAAGVLAAARARSLRVPEDLSVVGFDDIELGRHLDPPLTTVAQDMTTMGRWAVERLAAELAASGPLPRPEVVYLPVELHVRGSTAAPRRPAGPEPD
jgi:LacI family transcriptional regulator